MNLKNLILKISFLITTVIITTYYSFYFGVFLFGEFGLYMVGLFIPVTILLVYFALSYFKKGEDKYVKIKFLVETIMFVIFFPAAFYSLFIAFRQFTVYWNEIVLTLFLLPLPLLFLMSFTGYFLRHRNKIYTRLSEILMLIFIFILTNNTFYEIYGHGFFRKLQIIFKELLVFDDSNALWNFLIVVAPFIFIYMIVYFLTAPKFAGFSTGTIKRNVFYLLFISAIIMPWTIKESIKEAEITETLYEAGYYLGCEEFGERYGVDYEKKTREGIADDCNPSKFGDYSKINNYHVTNCYKCYAKKNKNPFICDFVLDNTATAGEGLNGYAYPDQVCFNEFVKFYKSPCTNYRHCSAVCDEFSGYDKAICYSNYAKELKTPLVCDRLSEEEKNWCHQEYAKEGAQLPEIEISEKDETVDWKTYEWNRLFFKYPSTWKVEKIYYLTPAQQAQGETPENIGLNIFPDEEIKEKDFIAIGGRQVSCEPSQNHTKCSYISSIANYTYTDSNNPDILKVFDQMLSTFRFTKEEESVTKTNVIRYMPTIAPNETYEGSCWINSLTAQRRDAWRCTVNNIIKDPCFVLKENENLVCNPNPITGDEGILLKLTEPLPESKAEDKFGKGWGWLIELEDGSVCEFVTGATGVINGKRLNYSCNISDTWILGGLEIGTAWKAEKVIIEFVEGERVVKSSELVSIRKVWQ